MKEKNIVEILLTVFTVEKGEVKILLGRRKREPYKGYWELPNRILARDENLEQSLKKCLLEESGLPLNAYKLANVFGDVERKVDNRIIGINYICFIDTTTISLKQKSHSTEDLNWFDINFLPKLSFDCTEIVDDSLKILKEDILKVEILKYFFPSDFTLPELQQACEVILKKELDRRNFRKYFMKNDLVEDTGDYSDGSGGSGRPAKLYRFKEKTETLDII